MGPWLIHDLVANVTIWLQKKKILKKASVLCSKPE